MAGTIISPVPSAVAVTTPLTATKTFYAAASSGGAVTTLNTVVVVNGRIITWTQTVPSGAAGQWDFSTADNSDQMLIGTWE